MIDAGGGRVAAARLMVVACAGGVLATMLGCRSGHAPPAPAASAAPETPAVTFAEPIVELRAAIGQRQTRDVRVAGAAAPRARLVIETVEDAALQVQVLPAGGVTPAGLRLAFTGDRTGTRTGQIIVTTGIAGVPRLTLLYALVVPSRVIVTPSNPYFNLRDPAARQRVLHVRGERADFRVLDARVVEGPFVATSLPADGGASGAWSDGEATVRVAISAGAVAADQRGFLGKLRLRTNDPAQPEVDVPLFAMGALSRAPGAASPGAAAGTGAGADGPPAR